MIREHLTYKSWEQQRTQIKCSHIIVFEEIRFIRNLHMLININIRYSCFHYMEDQIQFEFFRYLTKTFRLTVSYTLLTMHIFI